MTSLSEKASEEELQSLQRTMEERTCRVGGPRGAIGIVERVYQGRRSLDVRAKVLMESGAVRYVAITEVRCY